MAYVPDNVYVELLTVTDGAPTWTNISADVVSPITCNMEFTDGDFLSRLAPGSDMRFDLNNISGNYDPSDTFYKGQKIRLRVAYGTLLKVKFFGYIDLITLDPGEWGNRQAHVTAINWMALAAKTPIRALPGLTNTTIDAAVRVLLTQMQIQPEALDLEAGDLTLPSVFDQVTTNSTVYSELQNLVMGELGYIYMRDGGMTLKVENSTSRIGDESDYKTTNFYLNDGVETEFLLPDGSNFLLPDGTNFLLPGEPTAVSFDSNMGQGYNNISIIHGQDLINEISASSVPVVVGASTLVLYPFDIATGSKAFLIAANSSYTLQGQFKDPTAGGAQISGTGIVIDPATKAPYVTTDWKFNSLANGSGSDLSSQITITFTAGQSGFKAVITNSGAPGYITKFNVRGTPIYRYSPVETVIRDQRSIWDNGDYSLQFTRQYGQSSDDIRPFLFRLLMRNRNPRTVFSNPKFQAGDGINQLAGFMLLEPGDQLRLASTRPPNDGVYYIQGTKFMIEPGSEQIKYEYKTTEVLAGDVIGITESAIEQTGGTLQHINFGYLPSVAGNHAQRSIVARIYLSSVGTQDRMIFSINNRSAFYVGGASGSLRLRYLFQRSTSQNLWRGDTVISEGVWLNVVVTYDTINTSNNPIFYINGAATTTTNVGGGITGTPLEEAGHEIVLGNYSTYVAFNTFPFTGRYENVAEYNRILTPAEVTTIHNGGVRLPFESYPKNGLRFFAAGVDSILYSQKLDDSLETQNTVYDLWTGFTGQPNNGPVLRAVG